MKKHLKKVLHAGNKPLRAVKARVTKNTPEFEELSVIPRITNETLAQHREEILKGARKFIYPLQHSKHKVVLISTALAVLSTITFFTYCTLALYKFHSTSDFLYKVTKVIPFPIARVKGNFVYYENYLFELKHYVHFYSTQQKVDFNSASGKQQLADEKKQLLQLIVDRAYIKILAKEKNVEVSSGDVDKHIKALRDNGRLGSSDKVYINVLRDSFDWTEQDFRREIKEQLLVQKLLPAIDTVTNSKVETALGELATGKDFGEVAAKYSDDASTKDLKGDIGLISRTSRDVPIELVEALFSLQPGQYTTKGVTVGTSVELLKYVEAKDDKVRASHIEFKYKDITELLNDLKDKNKARLFVKL